MADSTTNSNAIEEELDTRVELGYLCRKGHFIFFDEPDVDDSCGPKKIASVYVEPVEGAYPHRFEDAIKDAREDFGEALGRAYADRGVFEPAKSDEESKLPSDWMKALNEKHQSELSSIWMKAHEEGFWQGKGLPSNSQPSEETDAICEKFSRKSNPHILRSLGEELVIIEELVEVWTDGYKAGFENGMLAGGYSITDVPIGKAHAELMNPYPATKPVDDDLKKLREILVSKGMSVWSVQDCAEAIVKAGFFSID